MKKVKIISSVKYKFILILLIIIMIPIIIFSTVQVYSSKKNIIEQVKEEMHYQIDLLDKVLVKYVLTIEQNINYLQTQIELDEDKDLDKLLKKSMYNLNRNSDSIEHIYLALEGGYIYLDSDANLPKNYNHLKRPFYKDAIKNKDEPVLSSIYKWEDKNIITLSKAIKYKDDINGVLGIDINIDKISKLAKVVSNKKYMDTLILDSQGNIISDSNNKVKDINSIKAINYNMYDINKMDKYKNIKLALNKNNNYIIDYKKSKVNGVSIIKLVDRNYIINQFNKTIKNIGLIFGGIIILTTASVIFLCNKVWSPMKYIISMAQSIKNGNYNVKKIYNKENEFGLIEDSLYSMSNQVKKVQSQLEILAYSDTLLQINNKNKFFNRINKILKKEGKYGSILVIDINNFKLFNEKFGYGNGDTFLKKIVKYLLTVTDEENLFRYGDDEFIILLEDDNKANALDIVSKIHRRFEKTWNINEINYTIKVTILISDYNSDDNDLDYILRSFEYGMKEAKYKNQKTNYFDSKDINIKRKQKIKKILDTVTQSDKLRIYYQPIMNINENKYNKIESLIRISDEEIGYISPIEFICIAEETGQIYDIGLYILAKSCEKIIELDKEDKSIEAISINISVVQFMNENFEQDIVRIIDKYNIEYNRLVFEITENIFMHSYTRVVDIMSRLSTKGIRFAVDDFGTGFSSLSYILNLPIDIIKIDKSFIDDIINSKKNKDLVELIVTMSEKLGMEIIIEGVESKEQLEILLDLGCNNIQGYYFSKPIHSDKINTLL
ncbi:bifunctional diguanylate cyclase/phosphodiesterase [[Clostridium] dakarense]|uniref:bifunctional diguanylate cyclase/phosphodiesterase n=1 Tax=Faecalimicrobium dakarense TaxID=1301100 RepID=UPI0005A880D0|nr:EAL domain-containing protein [[Clostridium] dakarense]